MRIAIFTENFYPELSGISDSIIFLAKELVRRGHETTFFVPYHPPKNFAKVNLPAREIELGPHVKIHRFLSLPFLGPTGQARFAFPTGLRLAAIKKFKPDIIHTQDIYGAGLAAISAAKLFNLPIVGTNHTPILEFIKYSPIRFEWFKKEILRYVSWYYNRCDYVTAPSEFLFLEMMNNGFRKPHQAISNPIEVEKFTPGTVEQKIQTKKELGLFEKTIVCAGRLAPEKHIDDILRAMQIVKKKIPNSGLVIIGHGTGKKELKKLSEALNLEKEVKFMGFVETNLFIKIYRASDVFVTMSTAETQCLAMMQAMACKLPVIAARANGLAEYVNQDCGILVGSGDYRSLAEKIIFMLQADQKRDDFRIKAYEYVQNFSGPSIALTWEKLYEEVIAMKKRKINN